MSNRLRGLFHPETKWLDKRITDSCPCDSCPTHEAFQLKAVLGNPAEREAAVMESRPECENCTKRLLWLSECLCKLKWYEDNDERLEKQEVK